MNLQGAPSTLNTKETSSSSTHPIITSPSPRVVLLALLLADGTPAPRDLDALAESSSFLSLGVLRGWVEGDFSGPLLLEMFTIFGWAENASEVSGRPRRQSKYSADILLGWLIDQIAEMWVDPWRAVGHGHQTRCSTHCQKNQGKHINVYFM